jgi:hypothetical protein
VLHQTTIRLDQETVHAIEQACASARTSQAQFLREAVRMRLDTAAMIEPIRVAIAETIASVKSDLLDAMGREILLLSDGATASFEANTVLLNQLVETIGKRLRELKGEEPMPTVKPAANAAGAKRADPFSQI